MTWPSFCWLIGGLSLVNAVPNIVIIIADDLGWNDVGFHGMNHIPTPNIDALAASGVILQNYYVTPICTPSRSALMTGKHPIHTGMQHGVLYGQEPRGLPLSNKLLPEYLKELGYKTHLVGKWHLGSYKKEYLPLHRGFDSHFGFWTGKIDMYDHTTMEKGSWGHDFRRGFEVDYNDFGMYATDLYTKEAVKLIERHNRTDPLFLVVAHSAVHTGNPYEPIRAPEDVVARFRQINDTQRQKFAGVLTKLDESVGKVVCSLDSGGLLDNSVILFTTDNGGAPAGFNDNAGSNYPLRGTKNTEWEGGVRGAALLWSPLIAKKSRVATQMTHLVDWLPTLYGLAGGDSSTLVEIDGLDQWEALSEDTRSKRKSVLHRIDDIQGVASLTVDQWKVVRGSNYKGAWDNWYGPDGREVPYALDLVYNGEVGLLMNRLGLMPARDSFLEMRELATVKCNETLPAIECKPKDEPCLFDVQADPCERRNVAVDHPEILQRLLDELSKLNQTAVPPNNRELDPRGDPKFWGRVYTNFGDYEQPKFSGACV